MSGGVSGPEDTGKQYCQSFTLMEVRTQWEQKLSK